MTETKFASDIVEENEKLTLENEQLKKQLTELQAEHHLVVVTIVKVLKSVGLWPLNKEDSIVSKALKGVKMVMTESVLNPKGLEERFSFVNDIYPLCEKYKDIEI
jgi:hypothetical protein